MTVMIILQVCMNGVRSFVVSEKRKEFEALEAKFYVVDDVLKALQTYARTHREK